jgi:hypothetical protein
MMVKTVKCFLLKKLRIYLIFFISLLLFVNNAFAQESVKLLDIIQRSPVNKVSVDRKGNIYIADTKGNVDQYSPEGNLMNTYSPSRPSKIEVLESWEGMRTFIFKKDLQEFTFLDRFMNLSSSGKLNSRDLGFIKTATLANDNNFWVIDNSDFSLKKIHPHNQNVILQTPLNLITEGGDYDFTFIKEYQNQVYLLSKNNGIIVFDNLGNYINKLDISAKTISFHGNYIYFTHPEGIKKLHIYKNAEEEIKITPSAFYEAVIKTDKYLYLFTKSSIEIYLDE